MTDQLGFHVWQPKLLNSLKVLKIEPPYGNKSYDARILVHELYGMNLFFLEVGIDLTREGHISDLSLCGCGLDLV